MKLNVMWDRFMVPAGAGSFRVGVKLNVMWDRFMVPAGAGSFRVGVKTIARLWPCLNQDLPD